MTEGRPVIALTRPRYVVTSVTGYLTESRGSYKKEGTSYHVIDTVENRRMVATYRSEDFRERARAKADQHAAALNAGDPSGVPRRYGFRPTCPRCGKRGAPRSVRCHSCGRDY